MQKIISAIVFVLLVLPVNSFAEDTAEEFIGMVEAGAYVVDGPAPPLTDVQVIAVYSSDAGWEAITKNQSYTDKLHGGAKLTIVTRDYGWGPLPLANLNGTPLTQTDFQPIEFLGFFVGMRREWDAS